MMFKLEYLEYFINTFIVILIYFSLKKSLTPSKLLLGTLFTFIITFLTASFIRTSELLDVILAIGISFFYKMSSEKNNNSAVLFMISSVYVTMINSMVYLITYIAVNFLTLPKEEILVWTGTGTCFFILFTIYEIETYRPVFRIFYPEYGYYNYKSGIITVMFTLICILSSSRFFFDYNQLQLSIIEFIIIGTISLVGYFNYILLVNKESRDILLEQQKQESIFEKHVDDVKTYYQEILSFKHDYQNILQSLGVRILKTGDQDLIKYFNEITKFSGDVIDSNDLVKKIDVIKDVALQGIIFSEAIKAQKKGIDLRLSIPEEIDSMGSLQMTMTRIISILLDNAIEETEKISGKYIELGMISYGKQGLDIILRNKIGMENSNFERWFEAGYTTKGKGHGQGLAIVQKIVQEDNRLSMQISKNDDELSFIVRVENDC